MDMETVNETVEKVDQGLEEIGLGGVSDNIKEILNLKEYMAGQIPAIVGSGLKVVLAIIVFFVGRKLIRWAVKLMKRSMERARLDEGVVQFACSAGKAVLYTCADFNIAVSLGVTESSVSGSPGVQQVATGLALQETCQSQEVLLL